MFFKSLFCLIPFTAAFFVFSAIQGLAQVTIYQQNFDNPIGVNGDIYFNTSAAYNGITDGSSRNGIGTGASFAGNPLTANGIIGTGVGGLVPQSGMYFLEETTQPSGAAPSYADKVYSVSGIPVLPNSVYRLTFDLGAVNAVNSPLIQVSIGGVVRGAPITPPAGSTPQFTYFYNSGGATTTGFSLDNLTVDGADNDFAIDSIQIAAVQVNFAVPGLTRNQTAIAQNLSSELDGVSTAVLNAYSSAPAGLGGILDQLSPEQFARFTSVTAFNQATFESEAMDNYLATQRQGERGGFISGNGRIDASGLAVNDPSYDPTLRMVHSRLLAWNPAPIPAGAMSDMATPLLGGVELRDNKDMKAMAPPAYTDPWNFFVRGNVILAQGFSQSDVGHFDENTESVVLGTDYRVTPHFLVGLTAGYGHTDATLDPSGSSATVDSYSPGFYASYAEAGWYANLTGDYIHNAYTQGRTISFLGETASSAPEGNEGVANLDGGYDFHRGGWTFGPIAGLQYTHLSVNGFNESGSVADLTVQGDDADSLRSRLGGRVSYALAWHGMTFTPHLDASWQHEFMDQARGITSQFNTTGLGSFTVRTENPQRDFALANVGLDADLCRTITLFGDYAVQAGQENYFGQSVQAGVKVSF